MASPASSVLDTQLGLSSTDIQTLRQHQALAAQHAGAHSSRAASNASSQGRLLLDPGSLQRLSEHFDRVMAAIQQRWAMVRPINLSFLDSLPPNALLFRDARSRVRETARM